METKQLFVCRRKSSCRVTYVMDARRGAPQSGPTSQPQPAPAGPAVAPGDVPRWPKLRPLRPGNATGHSLAEPEYLSSHPFPKAPVSWRDQQSQMLSCSCCFQVEVFSLSSTTPLSTEWPDACSSLLRPSSRRRAPCKSRFAADRPSSRAGRRNAGQQKQISGVVSQ